MILTDYFLCEKDATWDFAKQCGIESAVIRAPETDDFDLTNLSHWKIVYKKFTDFGIKPIVLEPMPNQLHDHIKIGDAKRDECIEQVIKMMSVLNELNIRTICFNWMAHIGWLRTSDTIQERGGALVTGFNIDDFKPKDECISEQTLWENYAYFIKSIIPYAEKYNVKLALHPDDPPISPLGNVSRIMISLKNIEHAVRDIVPSDHLGVTFCQATYKMMGEDLENAVKRLKDKIFFVHFRNVRGVKTNFNETFHDNGIINMAEMLKIYKKSEVDVPIRVDHVPTLIGETAEVAGYGNLGRLFAIGYLKGLLENNLEEI